MEINLASQLLKESLNCLQRRTVTAALPKPLPNILWHLPSITPDGGRHNF